MKPVMNTVSLYIHLSNQWLLVSIFLGMEYVDRAINKPYIITFEKADEQKIVEQKKEGQLVYAQIQKSTERGRLFVLIDANKKNFNGF